MRWDAEAGMRVRFVGKELLLTTRNCRRDVELSRCCELLL
jgi:hypothetical protein